MAFLDFVRNREAAQQQSVARTTKPETAKEMYTRQDTQDKTAERPITPEIKAQADRALDAINNASQHLQTPSAPDTAQSGDTPTARIQKQSNQDKVLEALSPTDGVAGKTPVHEKKKAPEKPAQRAQQTLPRRPPSWER